MILFDAKRGLSFQKQQNRNKIVRLHFLVDNMQMVVSCDLENKQDIIVNPYRERGRKKERGRERKRKRG